MRVDKFLTSQILGLTRNDIIREIKHGHLQVNGVVVSKPSWRFRSADKILFSYEIPDLLKPVARQLPIRFENSDLLVVDKPAGLPVYATSKTSGPALVNLLLHHYPALKNVGETGRPGIVHRLDKDTSGLIIIAKNQDALEYLKNLFAARQVQKEYLASVYGRTPRHGKISKSLTRIGQGGRSRVRVAEAGRPALTQYHTLRNYQFGVDDYSLVAVKLHTGRTHQIRVHFSSIGHPVMGDKLYGKPRSQKLQTILNRQFLHASRLEFQLKDGTWVEVNAKLPEDLEKVLLQLNKISNF